MIRVNRPGLLTTVQDRGRWGWQHLGVPVGGAMDDWSLRLANRLVGNPDGAAGLEITLLGPELVFDTPTLVAVTGALADVTLDRRTVERQPFEVEAGSVVAVGACRRGARAYLAVNGGIATPLVLGSRATHLPSGLGGLDGRALVAGDVLPVGHAPSRTPHPVRLPASPLPVGGAVVRILSGPDDWAGESVLSTLTTARFIVSPESNRMGYRLTGPELRPLGAADMISDAVAFGTIQLPPSGQPILLMADRQTSGGYPRVATVISADLGLAGQLAPGDWIEFRLCDRRAAMAALIGLERPFLNGDP